MKKIFFTYFFYIKFFLNITYLSYLSKNDKIKKFLNKFILNNLSTLIFF